MRRAAPVAVAAVLLALLPTIAAGAGAPPVGRLAGPDRWGTAAAVSRATFAPGVPVAFVATGRDYPDAIAAGPAAAVDHGPVLLVDRDSVPSATGDELNRLQPGAIDVLGGPTVVSDAVVAALHAYTSGPVNRIYGNDRYDTAAAVSQATFAAGVPVAYIATGGDFADALAGGPAAGHLGGPLLLVARDVLPQATADELRRVTPARIVVLGGPSAVSDAVEAQLHAYAGNVSRAQGPSRFDTPIAVSSATFGPGVPAVYLAIAYNFPDALAGGPAAALTPGPLLLVKANCIPGTVNREIDRLAPGRVVVLGGTAVVGPGVEDRAVCPGDGPPHVPSVSPTSAPAFDDDAPDPDIVRVGTTYYAYTTGTTWGNHIGVLVSGNPGGGWHTVTGQPFGSTALGPLPGWQRVDTQTSPGVFFWAGRYVMFYDAVVANDGHYCISVATSANPAGPFQDGSGGPLVCQLDLGGSIDPSPLIDADGHPWLQWKNNDGSSPAVSQVWAAPLGADGVSLAGPPQAVMAKDSQNHPWETTVDDPQMTLVDGVYYLFFSGGDWQSPAYAVGYATCAGPAGPCGQPTAGPILSSYGSVVGPGGGGIVRDTTGQWWIAYQAWSPGCTSYSCGGKRKLYVAPLAFPRPT